MYTIIGIGAYLFFGLVAQIIYRIQSPYIPSKPGHDSAKESEYAMYCFAINIFYPVIIAFTVAAFVFDFIPMFISNKYIKHTNKTKILCEAKNYRSLPETKTQ